MIGGSVLPTRTPSRASSGEDFRRAAQSAQAIGAKTSAPIGASTASSSSQNGFKGSPPDKAKPASSSNAESGGVSATARAGSEGPAGPTVEMEQNVQEGLFRASLRRPLPARARCERLVWGPWQRNPRQASQDGEQLMEAVRGVEASAMVGILLEAARTLHLNQPLEANAGQTYTSLLRKCKGVGGLELEAEPAPKSQEMRYRCICHVMDDMRSQKMLEVSGTWRQGDRRQAESDGLVILQKYAFKGMSAARVVQRDIMAGVPIAPEVPSSGGDLPPSQDEADAPEPGASSRPPLLRQRPREAPRPPLKRTPLPKAKLWQRSKPPAAVPSLPKASVGAKVRLLAKATARPPGPDRPVPKAVPKAKAPSSSAKAAVPLGAPLGPPREPNQPPPGYVEKLQGKKPSVTSSRVKLSAYTPARSIGAATAPRASRTAETVNLMARVVTVAGAARRPQQVPKAAAKPVAKPAVAKPASPKPKPKSKPPATAFSAWPRVVTASEGADDSWTTDTSRTIGKGKGKAVKGKEKGHEKGQDHVPEKGKSKGKEKGSEKGGEKGKEKGKDKSKEKGRDKGAVVKGAEKATQGEQERHVKAEKGHEKGREKGHEKGKGKAGKAGKAQGSRADATTQGKGSGSSKPERRDASDSYGDVGDVWKLL